MSKCNDCLYKGRGMLNNYDFKGYYIGCTNSKNREMCPFYRHTNTSKLRLYLEQGLRGIRDSYRNLDWEFLGVILFIMVMLGLSILGWVYIITDLMG